MLNQGQLREKTISDFGHQWTTYTDNDGFYGSTLLLEDILNPFLKAHEVCDLSIAEIGSGTGRIVRMLSMAGAKRITAIEPSDAIQVLQENTKNLTAEVSCLHLAGEDIANLGPFDLVLSIGVLHHIPDPAPVVRAAYHALTENGRLLVWLYGGEGNELYLSFLKPLRWITCRIPKIALPSIAWLLYLPLWVYTCLCRMIHLPLADYMINVIGKMSPSKQYLIIYDQLNPAYAKYYFRAEAEDLLRQAGFQDVKSHHRRGYSWTVIGTKPDYERES
jgi:SAM-dependent methyltransferase